MKLSDPYGYEHYEALNHDLIQKDFGLAHTLKLGAEVKITLNSLFVPVLTGGQVR